MLKAVAPAQQGLTHPHPLELHAHHLVPVAVLAPPELRRWILHPRHPVAHAIQELTLFLALLFAPRAMLVRTLLHIRLRPAFNAMLDHTRCLVRLFALFVQRVPLRRQCPQLLVAFVRRDLF